MKFTLPIILTGLLAAVAAASPITPRQANSTQEFKLKTSVVSGDAKFADLYPQFYHTGAGTADMVLTSARNESLNSYFNGTDSTQLLLDLGGQFPYGWAPTYVPYACWSPMTIQIGGSSAQFKVVDGKLEYVYSGANMEWLACDWWHGVPQVFWYLSDYCESSVPSNCAVVEFEVEDA